MSTEKPTCRGCGMVLVGKPYYTGEPAYHPNTGKRVPRCFYGGFVCSEKCDRRACYELESSMPGNVMGRGMRVSQQAEASIRRNWELNGEAKG